MASPRNTFGYREAASQQHQHQFADANGSGHTKSDSLTIGDDIYAIINEFSVVADSRYGEVDARSLKKRELSNSRASSRYTSGHSPALSSNYPGMASPGGRSPGGRSPGGRSPGKAASQPAYRHPNAGAMPTVQPGGMAKDMSSVMPSHTWLNAALRSSGDSADGDLHTAQQAKVSGDGYVITGFPLTADGSAGNGVEKQAYLTRKHPAAARHTSSSPFFSTTPPLSHAKENSGDSYRQESNGLYKRESHTNVSLASANTSQTDIGGRHTAARARAWAARQKERMLNAFSGDRIQRRSQNAHMPIGASKLSSETQSRILESPLEPPSPFRFHHQSHSATNVLSPVSRINRPPSADSLH
ncbi:hypothetical protein BX070DRAFT_226412 [Coemansia spiralis]|nr:hypothetical protein BX070DRAFT_226412 [Coemansia spiralis]